MSYNPIPAQVSSSSSSILTSYEQLPPYYTSSLNPGERRLQMTSSSSQNHSGTYTYSDEGFTVVLYNQKQDARCPTFDGLEPVTGLLIPSDSSQSNHDTVSAQVCILNLVQQKIGLTSSFNLGQLHGKHSCVTNIGGPREFSDTRPILDKTYLLWKSNPQSQASSLPTSLPFSVSFNPTFVDIDKKERPLPPTHKMRIISGVNTLSSKCKYTLKIVLSRPRKLLGRATVTCVVLPICLSKRPV